MGEDKRKVLYCNFLKSRQRKGGEKCTASRSPAEKPAIAGRAVVAHAGSRLLRVLHWPLGPPPRQ